MEEQIGSESHYIHIEPFAGRLEAMARSSVLGVPLVRCGLESLKPNLMLMLNIAVVAGALAGARCACAGSRRPMLVLVMEQRSSAAVVLAGNAAGLVWEDRPGTLQTLDPTGQRSGQRCGSLGQASVSRRCGLVGECDRGTSAA